MPAITDNTYGFVERLVDTVSKRCIFSCAGLSELGTVGAAKFLSAEWSHLCDRYGFDKGFVIMLKFDPSDYTGRSIIFER